MDVTHVWSFVMTFKLCWLLTTHFNPESRGLLMFLWQSGICEQSHVQVDQHNLSSEPSEDHLAGLFVTGSCYRGYSACDFLISSEACKWPGQEWHHLPWCFSSLLSSFAITFSLSLSNLLIIWFVCFYANLIHLIYIVGYFFMFRWTWINSSVWKSHVCKADQAGSSNLAIDLLMIYWR